MNKSLSKKSSEVLNSRAAKLRELLGKNEDALGELRDARICNDIAIDLYNLRKSSGITQKELAGKLGVKQSNISRWENPGYQGYKVKILSKLVRAIGGEFQIVIAPLVNVSYIHERFTSESNKRTFHIDPSGVQTFATESTKASYEKTTINIEGVRQYASL